MPNQESLNLEPPPRTSIDDPGAHELESEDSEDHFSDAQSGRHSPTSPVPLTRVEKLDSEPRYGEVPGTEAYNMRVEDAQPDQIAVIPGDESMKAQSHPIDRPPTPGGHPIPITVLETVDASSAKHTGLPRSSSPHIHKADAEPDLVLDAEEARNISPEALRSRAASFSGDKPIPVTKVEKVDSVPSYGEVPGTDAYEMRKGDAEPDIVEEVGDVPGSPTSHLRSPTINNTRRKSSTGRVVADYDEGEDGDDDGDGDFGDDFDDFEEGGDDAEFDDFDGGFQEAETVSIPPLQSLPILAPSFPVLNFDELDTSEEVMGATEPYIEAIFPIDTIDTSTIQPAPHDNPIFITQRSASLWSQLVAPPPLQPPNWIRSRIRRLFLVSLGVPVDLDEILPASKQKKLILPSIHLAKPSSSTTPRNSTDSRGGGAGAGGSISRLKHGDGNASSTSLDSQGGGGGGSSGKPSHSKRRRGPPPAPELDLVYARQLCSITDEALNGLTVEELREHVAKLLAMQGTAKEVLDYWTKRTDEKIGDRDAFEGVIENLVKHARKVRK